MATSAIALSADHPVSCSSVRDEELPLTGNVVTQTEDSILDDVGDLLRSVSGRSFGGGGPRLISR
jgi:hypothetical protein